MDEFLSQHARTVLLGDRRCTANNRDGTRCGRASALGQFVCDKHGAKAPLSLKAGQERLNLLVEPAFGALLRALKTGPPCAVCGRSDADRDPVTVRAAQIVLDRAGYGPSATVHVTAEPDEFDDLTVFQVADRAEEIAKEARAMADAEAARLLLPKAADSMLEPTRADPGFLVPEDDDAPAPDDPIRFVPQGDSTKEPVND